MSEEALFWLCMGFMGGFAIGMLAGVRSTVSFYRKHGTEDSK
jgi:hypothetical protein